MESCRPLSRRIPTLASAGTRPEECQAQTRSTPETCAQRPAALFFRVGHRTHADGARARSKRASCRVWVPRPHPVTLSTLDCAPVPWRFALSWKPGQRDDMIKTDRQNDRQTHLGHPLGDLAKITRRVTWWKTFSEGP